MAQTNYTPIQLYYSSTASAVPVNTNLLSGELAINITDGILFYKDNAGTVQKIGYKLTPTTAGGTGLTSFTANGVVYASSTSALTTGSALTFDGTNFGVTTIKSTTSLNLYAASAYDVNLYTGATNTARLSSNVNGIFTVGDVGSVGGLGTNYGTIGAWGTAGGGYRIYRGTGAGTSIAYLYADASGVFLTGQENVPMSFSVNGSEAMRIASATGGVGAVGIGYSTLTSVGNNGLAVLGNVGIGTSSPSSKLNVYGNYIKAEDGTYAGFFGKGSNVVASGGTADLGISTTTGNILFGTGALVTERVRIDSSGNVGIGTSSPSSKLDITGAANAVALNVTNAAVDGNTANLVEIQPSNGAYYGKLLKVTSGRSDFSDSILFLNTTSGMNSTNGSYMRVQNSASADIFRIDGAGNVGIGQTSPAKKLDVYLGTTGTVGQYLRNTTINLLSQIDGTSSAQFGTETSHPLVFLTANTERARIDSSGNLLVGTTGTGGLATGRFRVQAASGADAIRVRHPDASGGTSATMMLFISTADAAVGSITSNGTSTAYNTSSDYRLKNTIAPMTGALVKLAQLKPVTYKWNADGSDGEGFIAHELAEVVPQCVTGEKDAVDADGKPVYQGIDTSFLVATLTAAIQELKAEFDAYKASHP